MKKVLAVAVFLVAVVAWSQSIVGQGKPGNQGPWPVTISGATNDGGAGVVQDPYCRDLAVDGGSPFQNTVVGVASTTTPANQNANRLYIELCNSCQNSGTPFVKCRTDGTAPVMAATNPGDVLGICDCIRYNSSASTVPKCISDTAATNVTSYECLTP